MKIIWTCLLQRRGLRYPNGRRQSVKSTTKPRNEEGVMEKIKMEDEVIQGKKGKKRKKMDV